MSAPSSRNPSSRDNFDCIVIGAGIAGMSVACELARDHSVLILEAESQPGYHATGRSAAFYTQAYGNDVVRALTAASRAFFEHPPDGFSDHPLLSPRGALYIARKDQRAALENFYAATRPLVTDLAMHDAGFARERVPVLRDDYIDCCVYEPRARHIDVNTLLHGFLRGFRAAGGTLIGDARMESAERDSAGWQVRTTAGNFRGGLLIDAAGAWADAVATAAGAAPCSLQPMRRTVCIVDMPGDVDFGAWPAVADVDDSFYFVPDSSGLLLSPADETPMPAADAWADDLDVAIAVDRLETATTLSVRRVAHRWAGLRTFAPDRTPVAGFDPAVEGLFWLAGQGGYGIQTAPALARLAAALVRGERLPADLAALDASAMAPSRARIRGSDPR